MLQKATMKKRINRITTFKTKPKMKRIFIIVILMCAYITQSCTNSNGAQNEVRIDDDFDLLNMPSFDSLDLIDSLQIVQLQSEDEHPIGEINRILRYDSLLYLICQGSEAVYVYNTKGEFLNRIYRQGHSSREYVSIGDAFVDKYNSTFNIYCRETQKLIMFDLLGKRIVDIKKFPKRFWRVNCLKDGYVGYMGNYPEDDDKPYNYWFLDRNMNVKHYCGEIDMRVNSHVMEYPSLSVYKDKCNGTTFLSNDIYSISSSNSTLSYHFDFGEYNVPDFREEDLQDFTKMNDLFTNYVHALEFFQETDNYCYIYTNIKGIKTMFVYDKKKKKMLQSEYIEYNKDILLGYDEIVGFDEGHFYSTLSSGLYRLYYAGKNIEARSQWKVENLRKKYAKPIPGDNPVILIWSIK